MKIGVDDVRRRLLTGFVTVAPIGVSLYVAALLVVVVGDFWADLFRKVPAIGELPAPAIAVVGIAGTMLLIALAGFLTPSFLGRWLISHWEMAVLRLPIVRAVYAPAKELMRRVSVEGTSFAKPVFIPYPRTGMYTLVFVTNDARWTIRERAAAGSRERAGVSLFLPTNPNPTTGVIVFAPDDLILDPGLSTAWGIKTAVSGGILVPERRVIPRPS